MASERVCGFNEHAQGILGALDKATPEEAAPLATSFVGLVVASGWDNCPDLCRDFARTLARAVPDSKTRASLVSSLLDLCQEGSDSLTRQLLLIIGENHERAYSLS